jgi:hypothetical protein
VEELSEWTFSTLPKNFPFIQPSSRKQMRDDEFLAQLLLQIEEGPKSYSQDDLDKDMSRFAENLISLLQASKKKSEFNSALNELDIELRKLTAATFPRSASILQVCMGLLCSRGIITGPLQRYTCHVTEQLAQLYPEVRSLSPVFDYGG